MGQEENIKAITYDYYSMIRLVKPEQHFRLDIIDGRGLGFSHRLCMTSAQTTNIGLTNRLENIVICYVTVVSFSSICI
jgi:hypothetical protein